MKTHVVKTTPEATLSEAVDLMDLYQVSGLPVVDEAGRLCGMLTESDVVRALLPDGAGVALASAQRGAGEHRVQDYMSRPAISISEHADVEQAAEQMIASRLKRLPVITDEEKVVGVLNRIDVIQALFEGNI